MKKISNLLWMSLLVCPLAVTTISGCDSASKKQENVVQVEGVNISAPQKYVEVNSTLQLATTVSPANATDQQVSYTSSDETVASVSSTGTITGLKPGYAQITCTAHDGGYVSKINITVINQGNVAVNLEELIEELDTNPYTTNMTGFEKYGLSDTTNVGVTKDADSQVLFEIPSDDKFESAALINVADITLNQIKENIGSYVTEVSDIYQLQTAFKIAKKLNDENKQVKINLPKDGKLVLDGTKNAEDSGSNKAMVLASGLNGTYLNGQGCTLEIKMSGLSPKGYFHFDNCKNVFISSIICQQDVPTSLSGEVKAYDLDLNKVTIKVFPEFNEVVKRLTQTPVQCKGYLEFSDVTEAPLQGGNFFAGTTNSVGYPVISGDETNGYEMTLTFNAALNDSGIGIYSTVFFSQYDAYSFRNTDCENIKYDDVTIHSGSGMGITGETVHNMLLNRIKIVRKENSRSLCTTTADGIHISMGSGDVKITNSIIEYTGDDALNIKHGYYYRVTGHGKASSGEITCERITTANPLPNVGDKCAVYGESDFANYNPDKGYYTVKEARVEGSKYVITFNERLVSSSDWTNCRVTFMGNTPNFEFSNNIVRNKRNRGILVQVPNALIKNNTFDYVGHGAIMLHSAMDVFNEATIPQEPTVINNKFMHGNFLANGSLPADIAIFSQASNGQIGPKGITYGARIENNYFSRTGAAAVSFRAHKDGLVKDNLFNEVGVLENNTEAAKSVISLNNSGNITVDGNYNQVRFSQNQNGVICRGTSGTKDVNLLENNYEIDFEHIDGEGGPKVQIPVAKAKPVIDGDLSDWNDSLGATDVVFDGYSQATAEKITKDAISDHFEIKSFKMTHCDDGLYFGFEVFDNAPSYKDKTEFWNGDCVEIMGSTIVDRPISDLATYYDDESGDTFQIAMGTPWNAIAWHSRTTPYIYENFNYEVQSIMKTISNGYIGEIFLPYTLFKGVKKAVEEGNPLALAIVVADDKRSDMSLTRVQISNVPHFVENYKTKTEKMPLYYFVDEVTEE